MVGDDVCCGCDGDGGISRGVRRKGFADAVTSDECMEGR